MSKRDNFLDKAIDDIKKLKQYPAWKLAGVTATDKKPEPISLSKENIGANFGSTKCGLILLEKCNKFGKRYLRVLQTVFSRYMEIAKEVDYIENDWIRHHIANALIYRVKGTIYNDIKLSGLSAEDAADLRHRIFYCIKFRLNELKK